MGGLVAAEQWLCLRDRWRQKGIFECITSKVLGEAEEGNWNADSTYKEWGSPLQAANITQWDTNGRCKISCTQKKTD
jgi:hypothetical protein